MYKYINTPKVPNQKITGTYKCPSTPIHRFSLTPLASHNGNAYANIELTVCSCSRFCFLSVTGDFKPWAATLLFDIMLIDLCQVPCASHSCTTCGRPSTPLTIVTRHEATIVCYEGINMAWVWNGYFRLYFVLRKLLKYDMPFIGWFFCCCLYFTQGKWEQSGSWTNSWTGHQE